MQPKAKSIRTFIGAKDFEISKSFYKDLGFEEIFISEKMSLFKNGDTSFYLQDYYVKEWIENTMVLLEVEDADAYFEFLQQLQLHEKHKNTKLIPVQQNDWGKECLLIDPAGALWHFASFNQ